MGHGKKALAALRVMSQGVDFVEGEGNRPMTRCGEWPGCKGFQLPSGAGADAQEMLKGTGGTAGGKDLRRDDHVREHSRPCEGRGPWTSG